MKDIITWLKEVEHVASEVYAKIAADFSDDINLSRFLSTLAEEEAWHYHAMGSADSFLESEHDFQPAISVDNETAAKILQYFSDLEKGISKGTLTREEILSKVVEAELSEWNDIFLYVVNTLKEKSTEFKYPAARIQAHVKGIEDYLQNIEKRPDLLSEITALPPIWIERILIVEDDEMIASLIKSILNREGKIDIAYNGKEGLKLVQKNYYKLIISDIDMPDMDGLTLFKKSVKKFSNLHSRFLFITGNLSPDRVKFFKKHKISYLAKPMEIKQIRESAFRILMDN